MAAARAIARSLLIRNCVVSNKAGSQFANAFLLLPVCSRCQHRFLLRFLQARSASTSPPPKSPATKPDGTQSTPTTASAPSDDTTPLPSNDDTKKLVQVILHGSKKDNVLQRNPGRSAHFRMATKQQQEDDAKLTSNKKSPSFGGADLKEVSAVHSILATAKLSARHFIAGEDVPLGVNAMHHPVYSEAELDNVRITHHQPENFIDKCAYYTVQAMRFCFDVISGYKFGQLTETKWLNRIIFLETVAAVPGMVGGMLRHLNSLRRMKRDYGWIHTMLEEAENERMHLMTAVHLRQPGFVFRMLVLVAQGMFVNFFFVAYLVSSKYCHRFVGYLEEEAVKTYTHCLADIDSGRLDVWRSKRAPKSAIRYWRLREDATMRDMIRNIRADEAHHRVVNHTLAAIHDDTYNPFRNLPQGGGGGGADQASLSQTSPSKTDMTSPPKTTSADGSIPQLVQKSDKRNLPIK